MEIEVGRELTQLVSDHEQVGAGGIYFMAVHSVWKNSYFLDITALFLSYNCTAWIRLSRRRIPFTMKLKI